MLFERYWLWVRKVSASDPQIFLICGLMKLTPFLGQNRPSAVQPSPLLSERDSFSTPSAI